MKLKKTISFVLIAVLLLSMLGDISAIGVDMDTLQSIEDPFAVVTPMSMPVIDANVTVDIALSTDGIYHENIL